MKSGWQPAKGYTYINPLKDVFTYQPLRHPNECINAILEGEDCLWLTTAKGLVKYTPATQETQNFHQKRRAAK